MSTKLCLILILFLKILCVTCLGNSSLTFVIDDTYSMRGEIDEVIRGSYDLLDYVLKTKSSEIEDLILVTFNDPGVKLRANTNNKTEFIRALKRIHVYDGGDCPEYSMEGIIEALEISRPNSYLYVFTDANAKDFWRVEEVINLCEQKQSQVIFVLTGKCGSEDNIRGYNVYYKIAKACSGSIITIGSREVHLAVNVIKDFVEDKKTILTMITVQHCWSPTQVSFTLDEKIEHAIIAVSGSSVQFYTRDSVEPLMWTNNFKVVKLVNTNPGNYTAWVSGDSEVSIVVYGKTDLTFEYGFSEDVPKSLADTSKQPVAGKEHYLSISVRDPEHEIKIQTAAIMSTNEKVLMEFPLRKIGTDFYITKHLLPPETSFKVAVKGTIIKTGQPIVRVSKISVKPRLPDAKIPRVTIKEGSKIEVNYGSSVSLHCEVSAYPKPKIQWYDPANSNFLESQSSMIEFPYKYVSNLKMDHIKRSKSYLCEASNDRRIIRDSIQINVISPIKWIAMLPAVTKAAYGKELKLKCLTHSSYTTETKWYFNGPYDKLSLSADRSELTIKEMEMDVQGEYSCKVFLKDDPEIAEVQTTRVQIDDLALPEIRLNSEHLTVPEKMKKAIISCRIVKGNPRPKLSWQYRKNDASELISLEDTSEDLTINDLSLKRTGKYVCTATNIMGSATAVTELEVLKLPEIFYDGGSRADVPYDGKHVFTCRVVAHPSPTILWKDEVGNIVHSTKVSVNEYEFTSRLDLQNIGKNGTYSCVAENSVGKSEQKFEVHVITPLTSDPNLKVLKVKYGEKVKLKCDIPSDYLVERNWFVNGSKEVKKSDDKYSLTLDANELVIHSMDINLQGKYVCRVRLQANPNIFADKNIELSINDLALPEIRLTSEHLTVPEKRKNAIISCRIVKGNPRPKISWQYRKNDASELISLEDTSEDLTINDLSLKRTGKYVCTATNIMGSATAVTELEVLKSPKIFYDGGSRADVPYDGKHVFTCRVIAHPSPTILWKDEVGNIVHSTKVSVNEYEFTSRLDLQNIGKNGTYSCVAENSVGKSEQKFEVHVITPLTSDPNLKVLKVKYGEKVKLKCDIPSDYLVERNWFVNGSKEVKKSDNKYSLTLDANELVIHSMDINLQGKYVCRVRLQANPNIFADKNIALSINDLAPPKLASSKEIVNQTFIARCVITSGIPRPVVTWRFKGDSKKFEDLEVTSEVLIINNFQRQHNGSYQCIGKNPIGTDNAILSLEVKEGPKIITDRTEYRGVVGDKVLMIPCNVTGYPDPKIVWKNSNNEIIETGSKYNIKGSSNILSLHILNPIENDTGKLTCEAYNKVGNTTKTFDILVETNVTGQSGNKHNIYLLEDESKDINCTMLGSDSISLRWYKNGYLTNVTGTTYSIKKATVSDDGNYTCRVNTEVGSVSETFVVDVGYRPMFVDDEKSFNWFGDEEDVVNCSVRAKPAATVEWLVDGEKTSTKEFEHRIHGWGKYKCKVSNVHGVDEKTVIVTTSGCLLNRTMDEKNNPPFIFNTNINVDYEVPIFNYNKYMFIDQGQQMKLTCYKPGHNTFNLFPDKETIIAECDREDKFISEDKTYNYSDLKCKEPLIPTLKATEKSCVNADSILIKVGFKVPYFVEAYEICYDNKLNLTNFGYSKLSQYHLGNPEKKWTFSDAVSGIDICDEESKCCYGKGQLVNAADVDIGPPQITPFVDLNAISVWRPCEKENRMTWRKLEEAVRSILLSYNSIQVWSGASEYENVDDRTVPRYLWKVLKVKEDIIAVIVYVNTPKPKSEDIKCKKPENIPEELEDSDDPFTYLCSLEEFSKAFVVPIDTFSRYVIY